MDPADGNSATSVKTPVRDASQERRGLRARAETALQTKAGAPPGRALWPASIDLRVPRRQPAGHSRALAGQLTIRGISWPSSPPKEPSTVRTGASPIASSSTTADSWASKKSASKSTSKRSSRHNQRHRANQTERIICVPPPLSSVNKRGVNIRQGLGDSAFRSRSATVTGLRQVRTLPPLCVASARRVQLISRAQMRYSGRVPSQGYAFPQPLTRVTIVI